MTIGDVMGVTGLLLALGICSWAIMTAGALLFPAKCKTARSQMEDSPWQTLILGLAVTLVGGVIGLGLLGSPLPPIKLVGWILLTVILTMSAIGAGGLALLMGDRLKVVQPDMSEYGLISRGAMLVFICALTPILGWFLIAPVAFGMSVGAGWKSLFARRAATMSQIS